MPSSPNRVDVSGYVFSGRFPKALRHIKACFQAPTGLMLVLTFFAAGFLRH